MKSKLKRTIALLLCLVMAMTALPVKKALAAGQITVVSEGNDAFDYFEKYIDGEWSDLHTPKHTIVETGEVAYCIQHKLPNPHGTNTASLTHTSTTLPVQYEECR